MSTRSEAASKEVMLKPDGIRCLPAHTVMLCAGVFVIALAGCDKAPSLGGGDRTLELQSGTLDLESGVRLHDVKVRAVSGADFEPTRITAQSGDVVRFTTADTRTHAVVIVAPTPEATKALDATGQLRSPPLVTAGQAWVISLKGVPAGTYTIACISHAGRATLLVQ